MTIAKVMSLGDLINVDKAALKRLADTAITTELGTVWKKYRMLIDGPDCRAKCCKLLRF